VDIRPPRTEGLGGPKRSIVTRLEGEERQLLGREGKGRSGWRAGGRGEGGRARKMDPRPRRGRSVA
jgi:hypothetical protein